ncbi:hypothetical protein QTI66_34850 [Variovorax sp. J22R133]|uniref:hypothetical protein n=1 Tax=Variovorax brevis TaxID=3053503 RepID=UPI002574CB24|nr:hypothetical protein [Variovorax sp. J22R133]MDM0117299.1 hypothetical protein [Variovorax sp. J22R133]
MKNDKYRLETLIGEMMAFKAFTIAMVAVHPAPDQLKHAFNVATEQMMADLLNYSSVSEDMIEGLRAMTYSLEALIEHRLKA